MNIKKGLICLLIVTMLSLCSINVTAASASKLATGTHNGYAKDVRSQPYSVTLILSVDSTTSPVNHRVNFACLLSGCGENIIINFQAWNGNNWTTVASPTPNTIPGIGTAAYVNWTPNTTGVWYFRATFDGNDQFGPCMSNTVKVTIVD